jgi:hypothetical protein
VGRRRTEGGRRRRAGRDTARGDRGRAANGRPASALGRAGSLRAGGPGFRHARLARGHSRGRSRGGPVARVVARRRWRWAGVLRPPGPASLPRRADSCRLGFHGACFAASGSRALRGAPAGWPGTPRAGSGRRADLRRLGDSAVPAPGPHPSRAPPGRGAVTRGRCRGGAESRSRGGISGRVSV